MCIRDSRWGASVSKQFQLTVGVPLTITTVALPLGTLTMAYPAGAALAATGGTPPYHFSATGMPGGLTINQTTGAITGTPAAAGVFNPTFTVTDQATGNTQLSIPITVAAPGTNSEDWVEVFPATAPTARQGAAMFYDSVHSRTILFGGSFSGEPGVLGDTDSWDGSNWTTLGPSNSPTARGFAAAAFDGTHGVGVLFGGQDQNGVILSDTWIWNGTTWTQANPSNSPPARMDASMAYDGHQIVLFAGTANNSTDFNDTWIWNGTTWTQTAAGAGPAPRQNAAMAFDSAHSQIVMFGGVNNGTSTFLSDTWLWNGTTLAWTQVVPSLAHPPARASAGMAYDSLRGQTTLFLSLIHI